MKCKHCGAELQADERFCYRCGQAVAPEPVERHCGHCGAELEPEAAFCWKCGRAAQTAEQPKTAQKASKIQKETPAAPSTTATARTVEDAKADLKQKTEALVLAAQKGDSDSFTELYRLFYQKVFALAKTTVRTDADAEDVLQLTFLKAWNNLNKLKNISAFSTWIQRITLNQCYSLLRKKHIDISLDNDDEDAEPIQLESDLMLPEVYAERSDLKARLGKIIRELSAVQQQTVTLYYFDELPVENIAWIMDCSVNTVKSRLFLARKSIKTEIEEQERKSGQPFYGIVGLATVPFGKLFVGQMESSALPESAAVEVLQSITQSIAKTAANAVGQATSGTAKGIAGTSAKTTISSAAKAGATAATKAAAGAFSKKIIAGVVAGVLALGAITGGTVAAISNKQKKTVSAAETLVSSSADVASQSESAFTIVTEGGQPDSSSNQELLSAYRAYLSLLEEEKEGIDNYIWQKGYTLLYGENDNELLPLTDDLLARPVALCDVYGDDLPELIYVGDAEPGYYEGEYYYNDSYPQLHIVTYREGKLVTLYNSGETEEWWDGHGDGWMTYHLFQINGSKDLYTRRAIGDTWYEDAIIRFVEGTDGKLHSETVCSYYEDYEEGGDPASYYGEGSREISEDAYRERIRSLNDSTNTVLMYSAIGTAFQSSFEKNGCIAMTCDEAISWLEKQLNLDPSCAVDKEMSEAPWIYNNNLAVSCATLSLSSYSGSLDTGIRLALSNYGFSDDHIISNNYGGSLAYTIAIKDYRGKDAAKGDKLIVIVAQGTTNPYETLRDIISNTDTSLRGYPVYSIVREFKQAICEELEKCGWLTGKCKILITGHSLGGATANYLAASLIDELPGQLEKEDIYCYTFAAINSIASDHPVEEGFENIHNIYNIYDTFSPEHFGSSLISGMGGGYGKFGHMDIYRKDHRSSADVNKAAPIQIADHINHDNG